MVINIITPSTSRSALEIWTRERERERERDLFDQQAQPNTARFTYRHAAFFNIKSKTGLVVDNGSAGSGAADQHQQ